ncbi:tetratricopeptide repeat protein [Nitrospina watsonii]|uniref:TPR_REGION domain-containing protein n=1 Tax=Nitrospina watsonii TaxID=1323948 RepID=A0ABN8W1Z2_9BACT|nr:tetratricopeptide repeat protein [Nitrospina watsonii]CAI2717211.1 TPR_REGION domain-containing protein [Nitrospina watsonii]
MKRFDVIAMTPDVPSLNSQPELIVEARTKRRWLQILSVTLLLLGGFGYYVYFTNNPLQLVFVEELKKDNFLAASRFNDAREYYQQGRWEEAMSTLAPLLNNETTNPEYLALGAWLSYKFDRYPRALELAEKTLALEPDRAREQALVGACYLAGGEVDRAIEYSKQAVRLDPNLTLPYLTLGEILMRQDRDAKAVLVIKRGARNNPRSIKAWNLLSSAYLKMERLDKAILAGQAALDLDPKSAEAHYNLSRAFYKQQESGPAIRHIQLAEDLYEARGDKNWTAQARQAKDVMLEHFKMRPQDIFQ